MRARDIAELIIDANPALEEQKRFLQSDFNNVRDFNRANGLEVQPFTYDLAVKIVEKNAEKLAQEEQR